jgi:hypothetical protein
MTDQDKQRLIEEAMERVVKAQRDLKLAELALKGAIDLASMPESQPVKR